ncbi:histidine N-acetyltransferase-like [Argopecten irradians]|uniref:histidine N-acetyltransferase-like n=1 Tax=Argopecten irradians TaxID=31199 RepID=UPI00371C7154
MMSGADVIECRKVTLDDYDEVINIRKDVYDGLDYLPALYRTMMTNHIGYVLTLNKKIIAFESISVIDDGESIVGRALRISKAYEGRGLVHQMEDFIRKDIAGNSRLKHNVFTTGNKTIMERNLKVNKGQLILQKGILLYKGDISKVVPFLLNVDMLTTRILNKDDLKKLMTSKLDTDRLFPQGRIIVDWVPYRLLASNVDHFFNDFCHILGSGDGNSDRIECMTVAVGYTAPKGIRYIVEMYGTFTEETFSDHIVQHLKRCSTLDTEHINFSLHYETGKHNPDTITKTMHQFNMNKSDTHFTIMYGVEEPLDLLSKY